MSSFEPKTPDIPLIIPLNFYLSVRILFKPFQKILGKFRNLRVWPVGAVSNTMTQKSIFQIELHQYSSTQSTVRRTLLHQCLAQNQKFLAINSQCLSHLQNQAYHIQMQFFTHPLWGQFPTSHKMYHGIQVGDAFYRGWIFDDFLIKTITEVMGRVSGDNQSFSAISCQKSSQTTTSCSFADTSFTSDKNPPEGLLVQNVPQASFTIHQIKFNNILPNQLLTLFKYVDTIINILQLIGSMNQKRKIFDEQCEFVNSDTILSSEFFLTQDYQNSVILVLTSRVCFYHEPQNRQVRIGFKICFEKIFQIMRTKVSTSTKVLGTPYGIRFLSEGFQSQRFYSKNINQLQRWEIQCRKLMNQFNFHELFKAEKRLGQGNFATVYLGTQLKNKKKMAIKAFAKQTTFAQENGKQALINEIKITRLFNHPNLMKIQGVYQSQNSLYFGLEFIEGDSLCERINKHKKYSASERKNIMRGILRGLNEMARRNVIHRDLKPQNIILSKQVTIIDFGLATIADDQKYLFVRCGTPGYVAPQIINIKDMSTKSQPISDIFSVGCIFFYLIFGRHLFNGKNSLACDIVLTGPQFDHLDYRELDLLRKMLQKEPQLRISAAQALKHPYLTDADGKVYMPKVLMRQSGSCPIDLISNENQAAVKFMAVTDKKCGDVQNGEFGNENLVMKVKELDVNKLLIHV